MPSPRISGTVAGPDGQPLPGIQVSTDFGAGVTTDADGTTASPTSPWDRPGSTSSTPLAHTSKAATPRIRRATSTGPSPTALESTILRTSGRCHHDDAGFAYLRHGQGPDGQPVAGASVSTFGGYYTDSTTDAGGRYDLSLPPGTYTIEIWMADSPLFCYNGGAVVTCRRTAARRW